ncbi:MAG: GAF domain-containing protein, partial [Chloroflexi bacterium]
MQEFTVVDNEWVNELVTPRQPIQIEDAAHHPYFEAYLAQYPDIKFRTWLGVPLIVQNRFIGQITLDRWTVHPYTPEEIELAVSFAHHAAIALENARLFDAEQRQRHIEQMLRQAVATLNETLELDEVLERIMHQLRQVIPFHSASVQRIRQDAIETVAGEGLIAPEKVIGKPLPLSGSDVIRRVIESRSPLAFEDAQQSPDYQQGKKLFESGHIRSWLGVPLIARDNVIGMITLDRNEVRPYTAEEIDLATAFAGHAALALENAEHYRQQAIYTHALEQTLEERGQLIEDLDAFAHTVAHDLKNPLGLILGYAEMLLSEDFDRLPRAKLLDNLRMIAHGAAKMNGIIQALLLMAGVRKAETVQIRALDMGRIVDETLLRMERAISDCGAEIHIPETWPTAFGYAPWVEEVWANYLSNALKYGGQPPRVTLGASPQADGLVCFWVRDNGRGLTPDEQRRIFTPFTRLRGNEVEGHGLGLSIVRRIVEKLGGQIGVESEV